MIRCFDDGGNSSSMPAKEIAQHITLWPIFVQIFRGMFVF